jgi:phospholipase C
MVARFLLMVAALAFVTACSSPGALTPSGSLPGLGRAVSGTSTSQYIKNVVVIIQENRSFENFFAGFPGANAPLSGYAKKNGKRVKVNLHETTFETNPNLVHNWSSAIAGWDKGKMDGFHIGPGRNYAAYAYVKRSQVATYWAMANQFVLADNMFPTEFGGSYTAHLTLVAGTDNMDANDAQVNFPTAFPDDCDSPQGTKSSLVNQYRKVGRGNGPFPCFNQFNTMARVLDKAGVSWKYYANKRLDAGIWSPFEAIKYVRFGSDWKNDIIAPETQVLSDIDNGQLASVSWVTPSHADSDHPGAHSDLGPSWVASIVNAIGQSSYWNQTAIVILWDDWGGWFDNAAPMQLDFRGLGERVPCLIISPYAVIGSGSNGGYVSDTQYEFGSILKFIEQAYNLPPLGLGSAGYTDKRANSIIDSFDFTQSPRKFTPFGSKYPASRFIHEPPSDEPVDTE